MKDLIIRIIGENRVKDGLDSAKGDIQKFSDAGKTFVKSLKDELSSIANNIPGLGNLTRAFGGVFAAAVGGAVMLGNALKRSIEDAANAWSDFADATDRDFTRMTKYAIEFNSKFRKARETGSVETAVEIRVNSEKLREDILAEIRSIQREMDGAGIGTKAARMIPGWMSGAVGNAIGPINSALIGTQFAQDDARTMRMGQLQNEVARLDREILSAKKLELDNAATAAQERGKEALKEAAEFTKRQAEIRKKFDEAGNEIADRDTLKNGYDPEKAAVANRMLDEGLAKLQALQGVLFPTEADIAAKQAATTQVLEASDILDALREGAAEAAAKVLDGDKPTDEDPAFWNEQRAMDEQVAAAQKRLDDRKREIEISEMSVDQQIKAREQESEKLKDEQFDADPMRKVDIEHRLLDLAAIVRELKAGMNQERGPSGDPVTADRNDRPRKKAWEIVLENAGGMVGSFKDNSEQRKDSIRFQLARLQGELADAPDTEKDKIQNRIANLRDDLKSIGKGSKRGPTYTDGIFQSINMGDAFSSLYGQRGLGSRDPSERTASASERALEVLKNIEKKTGAAP